MAYAPKKAKALVRNKHELSKLLKQLENASADAVSILVATMNSTEESVSQKMKIDCAEALINFQISVASTISKDSLTRTVADWKMNNGAYQLVDESGKSRAPMLNFDDIQNIAP